MFDRKQPEPRFGKALVATIIFYRSTRVGRAGICAHDRHVWFALTGGITVASAWAIHSRTINDWRASDAMHLRDFEERNAVSKNIRIRRR